MSCDRYDPSSGLCRRMHSTHLSCAQRLDYCNVVFAGLPASDLQRLQSVLNAAERLVSNSSSRCHVTPLLKIVTGCLSDSVCRQALHASPPLSLRRSTILSRRTRRPDCNEVHLNYVKCIIVYTHITLALSRLD